MSEDNTISDFIVERIRKVMSDKGWSQAELARQSGLSPMNVSDILNKKTKPSLVAVIQIADAAEVSIDDFFPPL